MNKYHSHMTMTYMPYKNVPHEFIARDYSVHEALSVTSLQLYTHHKVHVVQDYL